MTQPVYPDTGAPPHGLPPTTKRSEAAAPPAPAAKPLFPALGMRWPADRQTRSPLARGDAPASPVTPVAVQRLPARASTGESDRSPTADWVPPPLTDVKPPSRQIGNPVAAINTVSKVAAAGYQPPPGVRPRMVNSSTFHVDYDVTGAVPGGVHKVELWGTRDSGQRWSSYGADTDTQSPMSVTVEGEGMFGFCIVVQTANGKVELPPTSGQRPDTWVGVDLTRPTCRITQLRQEKLQQVEQLIVTWEAHDEWLAERPISLSYSEHPTGHWLPVATGLENTGRYTWPLDGRVPDRFYLRLEARDQAGNVELHHSPEAVIVPRTASPSRIREVRPTYETSQGPRRYRFW